MPVTQREIAEIANVSINTVSLVLRGAPDSVISDATREKILEIAEDLGYRPNPHARALVGGKAPLIKIANTPSNDYISNTKGATLVQALRTLQRDVLVGATIESRELAATIDSLLWGTPEAVVFQYPSLPFDQMTSICRALHDEGIHVVVADYRKQLPPDVPCDVLYLDRYAGARRGMDYLLSLGHRRIGLILHEGHRGRKEGYERALAGNGINERFVEKLEVSNRPADPAREAEFPALAAIATERLLDRQPRLTALLCSSDMIALGAMGALGQRDLRVPEDVSVLGFHGEPWTKYLPVPLSTLAEPVGRIAEATRDFLAARFEGDESDWKRVTINYRLVERVSTGPAPVS